VRQRNGLLFVLVLLAAPVRAADHNNLDHNRPSRVEDAEPIAFREQELDLGLDLGWPRRGPSGGLFDLEYLYGIAPNTHVELGGRFAAGGVGERRDRRFEFAEASLGAFHQFQRETERSPAFALRGDLFFPTARGAKGLAFRLRAIASRTVGRQGRVHANLDLNAAPGAAADARNFHPTLTLGYSRPLGYPRSFTRTLVADLAVRAGEARGGGPLLSPGIGIRRQISRQTVLDYGIQTDLIGFRGANRDRLRLIVGFSHSF